jgi:hypothetical protein
MTPQEKAKELFDKYQELFIISNADKWTTPAKQCVLILCDEIINLSLHDVCNDDGSWSDYKLYYTEVKNELEKMLSI